MHQLTRCSHLLIDVSFACNTTYISKDFLCSIMIFVFCRPLYIIIYVSSLGKLHTGVDMFEWHVQ